MHHALPAHCTCAVRKFGCECTVVGAKATTSAFWHINIPVILVVMCQYYISMFREVFWGANSPHVHVLLSPLLCDYESLSFGNLREEQ